MISKGCDFFVPTANLQFTDTRTNIREQIFQTLSYVFLFVRCVFFGKVLGCDYSQQITDI